MPLVLAANSTFRLADWAVLAAYLALLVATGVWFSRREQKTTNEYFLAGRRMPMWAVAVSIIATSLSAATFVGAPEQSYVGDLTYLSTNIGGLIAVIVVAYFFVPAFYRNNCTTVYELLERRFGPSSKYATSAAFMVGRLFASGARVYIAAIPMTVLIFGPSQMEPETLVTCMIASVVGLAVVGTAYALVGGVAGVIWTDVVQTVVLVIAVAAAIMVLLLRIHAPLGEVFEALRGSVPRDQNLSGAWGKLTLIRPGFDATKPYFAFSPSESYTVVTALFGFSLLNIAAYGTDHDLVQRMLTCRSSVQASKSVLASMAIGFPIVVLFSVIGLLLFVYYEMPFIPGRLFPQQFPERFSPNQVLIQFMLTQMPPGLAGLMLAGLFAAGVGSLTSAINAMAATFIKDFYTRWSPNHGERHYLAASKVAVVAWGIALAAFACLCVFWQRSSPNTTLISLALGVMTFAYAGLLAVFLTALFTRRGNTTTVIASLITGFVVIALLQEPVWNRWTPFVPVIGARLSSVSLAFPWHMTIGTTLAFLVCISGRPPKHPTRRPPGSQPATCSHCGYEMTGVSGGVCPECGRSALELA